MLICQVHALYGVGQTNKPTNHMEVKNMRQTICDKCHRQIGPGEEYVSIVHVTEKMDTERYVERIKSKESEVLCMKCYND